MSDQFVIRLTGMIDGVEIHPDTFDLSRLINLLAGVQEAIHAEAGLHKAVAPGLLTLNAIHDRCAEVVIGCHKVRNIAGRVTDAFARRDFAGLKLDTQQLLRNTFGKLIRDGASVQIGNGDESSVYNRANPLPEVTPSPSFSEETSLLVRVSRLGGKGRRGFVRGHFYAIEEDFSAECQPHIVQELARAGAIFEDVTLDGMADWEMNPWRLCRFIVKAFTVHPKGTATEVFRGLASVLGDQVGKLDADEHLRQRYGDEP